MSTVPGEKAPTSNLPQFLFGFRTPVTRAQYITTGLILTVLKYTVEAIVIWSATGRFFKPLDFLNPFLIYRQQYFEPPAPSWLITVALLWTFPFIWILVALTFRRAMNIGWSGIVSLLVLIPGLNYIVMLAMCVMPGNLDSHVKEVDYFNPPSELLDEDLRFWQSAFLGVLVGVVISLTIVALGVFVLQDYGWMIFFGLPILVGFVTTVLFNHPVPRGFFRSQLVTQVTVLASGLFIVAFAIEGIVCLVMLWPIAAGMACIGSIMGYAICASGQYSARSMVVAALLLPLLAGVDQIRQRDQLFRVDSSIVIQAPPEVVWENVVSFGEIDAETSWPFRLGVAMPLRATIDGSGVGAIRYCEFTTGSFVEPITVWEPGKRLAFDVESQPPPMTELSPYRHIHPPHLDHYLRTRRGEFRLVDLGDGRTRLEGSTWYQLDIHPQDYWLQWSDWCIHRIHMRVLTHIRELSE